MQLIDNDIRTFNEMLASKSAVPGGGGASALAGALGASLGHMVGSLTVGKQRFADVEEEMLSLMDEAKQVSGALLRCVDGDAEAFAPLARAYAIPKEEPGREEIMERCLRNAAAVPMEIARLCCRAIELEERFAVLGNPLAVSDAASGAALSLGALYAAGVNVRVNTSAMKDRETARRMEAELESLTQAYAGRAVKVYRDVCGKFG